MLIVPPLAYYVAYRICLGLQQHDREVLAHGVETGIIRRLPDGRFVEVHQPLAAGPTTATRGLDYAGWAVPKKMNRLGAARRRRCGASSTRSRRPPRPRSRGSSTTTVTAKRSPAATDPTRATPPPLQEAGGVAVFLLRSVVGMARCSRQPPVRPRRPSLPPPRTVAQPRPDGRARPAAADGRDAPARRPAAGPAHPRARRQRRIGRRRRRKATAAGQMPSAQVATRVARAVPWRAQVKWSIGEPASAAE